MGSKFIIVIYVKRKLFCTFTVSKPINEIHRANLAYGLAIMLNIHAAADITIFKDTAGTFKPSKALKRINIKLFTYRR